MNIEEIKRNVYKKIKCTVSDSINLTKNKEYETYQESDKYYWIKENDWGASSFYEKEWFEEVEGEKVEEVIKVRCIKTDGFKWITLNKEYECENIGVSLTTIKDETGKFKHYPSELFEKVTDDVLMVECIDNEGYKDALILGKSYQVIDEDSIHYCIEDELFGERKYWTGYNKERFKPVEPQKEEKEEYTVMEVLEMPTGTKLKLFPYDEFEREIMVVGGVADVKTLLYVDKEGCHEEGVIISSWIMEKPRFKVVEEPKQVNTSEAFKALEEGKEIESTYTGDKYKKENGLLVLQGKGFDNYCKCGSIAASELTNSWIIIE